MKKENEWVWMPHAGHLIVGSDCRFHLSTYVNGYVVSTVGEYFPDEAVREIHAKVRGINIEGRGDERQRDFLNKCGYIPIGHDRIYETMVFKAKKSKSGCCAWEMANGTELDFNGYNDAKAAADGHLAMCNKWAAKRA